jgi:ATP-dependent DNA ligase
MAAVVLGKDGAVCQVRTRGGGLVQRNVPEVVASLERLRARHVVLDGEFVVVDESGHTDFDAACARLKSHHGPPVTVFVFDWRSRARTYARGRFESARACWPTSWARDSTLRPVHFTRGPPDPLIAAVDDLELEGVVAKWEGAPYQGGRTPLCPASANQRVAG